MTFIEELERATEGSRELDGEIFFAAIRDDMEPDIREFAERVGCSMTNASARCSGPAIPHYTTSLDAALTLVPEGKFFATVTRRPDGVGHAKCHSPDDLLGREGIVTAATPALALCIAALKAIEHEKAKDSVTSS